MRPSPAARRLLPRIAERVSLAARAAGHPGTAVSADIPIRFPHALSAEREVPAARPRLFNVRSARHPAKPHAASRRDTSPGEAARHVPQLSLADLRPGESAVVRRIGDSPLKRRLQELGLDSGVTVTCLFRSPLGDPTAYAFASGTVAIRRADGESVTLWD